MSDQTPDAADELQFNEAEYTAPSSDETTCGACRQAIPDHYFQVNGAILCEPCSTAVRELLTGGSSFARFLKAGLYGFGAALAGFAIYYGVLKLTGYEVGLISILVGFMVGAAVRKGSAGRGGVLYQLMAVGFTYLAIAVSYSALAIPQVIAQIKADKAAEAQPAKISGAEQKQEGDAQPADGPVDGPADEVAEDEAEGPDEANVVLSLAEFVIAIFALFAFMFALPVIVGFSNPIGLLIVGFAVWEAWKLNRKTEIVITGPHHVGQTPEAAPAHA